MWSKGTGSCVLSLGMQALPADMDLLMLACYAARRISKRDSCLARISKRARLYSRHQLAGCWLIDCMCGQRWRSSQVHRKEVGRLQAGGQVQMRRKWKRTRVGLSK